MLFGRGGFPESEPMKLIRFGPVGKEEPGAILVDGTHIDVSAFGSDYDEVFFGRQDFVKLDRWLRENSGSAPRVAPSARLGHQCKMIMQGRQD